MSATEKPRRLTQGQILEMALARNTGPRNEVHLAADRAGNVMPRVTATHDDLAEAERAAFASMTRALEQYPPQPNGEDELDIELTRNAKGETQIKVSGKGRRVIAEYKALRAEFPLLDGTVSHDAPRKP